MRLLVVDSNTQALNERLTRTAGAGIGAVYAETLRDLDPTLDIELTAPYDGDAAPDPSTFDGVVFSGSSVNWGVEDPRVAPLAALMRDTFDAGRPTFGSCNGMQLAAVVLGGRSDVCANGHESGLARDVRLTDAGLKHPMMTGRTSPFSVPCVHYHDVHTLPDGAVLIAGNAHSAVQAFVYEADGVRFWGVQYHPEFSPSYVAGYLETFGIAGTSDTAQQHGHLEPEARTTELRNWLASLG